MEARRKFFARNSNKSILCLCLDLSHCQEILLEIKFIFFNEEPFISQKSYMNHETTTHKKVLKHLFSALWVRTQESEFQNYVET